DPEMDTLSMGVRDATSLEEIETKCHRIEEIIHRDAPWVPGYTVPFARCGYWRWMKWPDNFNVRQIRDVYSSYVYWIDEDTKKETLDAKGSGKTFPEQDLIFDQYRQK
ncbi:MAG: ABC transporter substrate-binding protein, partial [Akkermansiaceae bacterium]